LDIGCYTGEFLASLPTKYEKYGIEKCASATRIARQNGLTIVGDDLYNVTLAERFDVIVAMDVIEHVLNPSQFLRDVLSIVSDGGIVLLSTGDSDDATWREEKAAFWYCAFAEHISFISERWLKGDSDVNGFRIEHLQNFKYEDRPYWKTVVMRSLTHLCWLFGIRPHFMWAAHKSKDHLFAALRRKSTAADAKHSA